mgnify:CR=1 FL=1
MKKTTLICLSSILVSSSTMMGSVIFTPTSVNTASVDFDAVTFTASSDYNGTKIYFHIEDFYSSASTSNGAATGGSALLTIGSAAPIALGSGGGNPTGQITSGAGLVDSNDLFLDLTVLSGSFSWSSGDSLTLSGTGLSFGAGSLNTPSGTAMLNATIASGTSLAAVSGTEVINQVPEPSSLLLLSLGGLGIIRRRR